MFCRYGKRKKTMLSIDKHEYAGEKGARSRRMEDLFETPDIVDEIKKKGTPEWAGQRVCLGNKTLR